MKSRRRIVAGTVLFLVAGVAWLILWNRALVRRPIDLAVSNPRWTFHVTNDIPIEFEALFRIGNNIRRVHGRTPAEFRLGSRRIVAQFRPMDVNERMLVHMLGSDMGSASMAFPANPMATNQSVTFVSTHGKLGIPAVGARGMSVFPWGAREVFLKPWRLWPDAWVVTDAMLAALPTAEPWETSTNVAAISAASGPERPPPAK